LTVIKSDMDLSAICLMEFGNVPPIVGSPHQSRLTNLIKRLNAWTLDLMQYSRLQAACSSYDLWAHDLDRV